MSLSGFVASLHYIALAIGFFGLLYRGICFSRIVAKTHSFESMRPGVLLGDNFYGAAALLWIVTGVWRAFGGLEKGTDYYLANPLFWMKLGLFGAVFLIELPMMMEFIRWRIRGARGESIALKGTWSIYAMLHWAEAALIIAIVLLASQMARFSA